LLCTREIGENAKAKGLKPWRYKLLAIIIRFGFELFGLMLGGKLDILGYALGLCCACVGWKIAQAIAEYIELSSEYLAEMASRPGPAPSAAQRTRCSTGPAATATAR